MDDWSHNLPCLPCLSNANGNPEEKAELDGASGSKRPHYGFLNQASEENPIDVNEEKERAPWCFWSSLPKTLVKGLKADHRAA